MTEERHAIQQNDLTEERFGRNQPKTRMVHDAERDKRQVTQQPRPIPKETNNQNRPGRSQSNSSDE